jgi:BirA family biotin operon repressor/biotin-[acetyl-CoA-carboxylase] ligase
VQAAQDIRLKWPNDIVCSQGKLAGILIELMQLPSRLHAAQHVTLPQEQLPKRRIAIVGVGVNVERPLSAASENAAYLFDLSTCTPSLHHLAVAVLESVAAFYAEWRKARKRFAPFRDEYNTHLATRDRWVTVRDSNAQILAEGRAQGVDAHGYLLVEKRDGRTERIVAGEVTLRA